MTPAKCPRTDAIPDSEEKLNIFLLPRERRVLRAL